MKVLLLGEPMGLFIAEEPGPLDQAQRFSQSIAGAEYNVAVGLARLGHTPIYCSAVGNDSIGEQILAGLEANGIDAGHVKVSQEAPTGYMKKSMVLDGDPETAYFRAGSAASKITVEDVEALDLSDCQWLHVTGVFPAISESARIAVKRLMERAKEQGMTVSFDPNLRPSLWPSEAIMAKTLRDMAQHADLVLPGIGEARILAENFELSGGIQSPPNSVEEICQFFHWLGPQRVVVKLGPKGAYYSEKTGGSGFIPGIPVEAVVDTVGAGDGFAVGVISALAEGLPLEEAVRRGLAIGAIQVTEKTDNEGLPDRKRLEEVLALGRVPRRG